MIGLITLSFIVIILLLIGGGILEDIKDCYTEKHEVYTLLNSENVKYRLLKFNKKKFSTLLLFLSDNNEEEIILKLKKSYLHEEYIPNEFKILNRPKKSYYNYLNDLLEEDAIYLITYGKNNSNDCFLLSAKKITNEETR